MTSPEPVPPQAVTAAAEAIAEGIVKLRGIGAEMDSETQHWGRILAPQALEAAAPHLAAAEAYRFAALLDAINAIAAKVDLPLDLAANLMRAIASYGADRAAKAVAAERERCAQLVDARAAEINGKGCGSEVEELWRLAALLRAQP